MRKEILVKRNKIKQEIDILNNMRYEEKTDNDKINNKIEELKKMYNYYNSLLKVMK